MWREKPSLAFIAFATNEVYELLISWISIDKSSGSDSLYSKLQNSITNVYFNCKRKESSWTEEAGRLDFTTKAATYGNPSAMQVLKHTFFLHTYRNHTY